MIFGFFAISVAALVFVGCLIMLNYGRRLGLLDLQRNEADSMVGLPTVESAVFALIGLLIAFSISGALQRFDERRQLVIQEANAISTTYDRLGLFERDVAQDLQTKLKEYASARIELYRMPHDFSFWEGEEVWPREQQDKILKLKAQIWQALVAACPQDNFRPVCTLSVTALSNALEAGDSASAPRKDIHPKFYTRCYLGLAWVLRCLQVLGWRRPRSVAEFTWSFSLPPLP